MENKKAERSTAADEEASLGSFFNVDGTSTCTVLTSRSFLPNKKNGFVRPIRLTVKPLQSYHYFGNLQYLTRRIFTFYI